MPNRGRRSGWIRGRGGWGVHARGPHAGSWDGGRQRGCGRRGRQLPGKTGVGPGRRAGGGGRAHRVSLGEHDLSAGFCIRGRRDFRSRAAPHPQQPRPKRAQGGLAPGASRRGRWSSAKVRFQAAAPAPRVDTSVPACRRANPVHGGHFARPLGAGSGRFDQSARPSTR